MPQLFSNLTAFFSPLLPPSIKGSWLREGGRVITEVQVQEHSYRLIDIYFGYFGTNGKHDELVTRSARQWTRRRNVEEPDVSYFH